MPYPIHNANTMCLYGLFVYDIMRILYNIYAVCVRAHSHTGNSHFSDLPLHRAKVLLPWQTRGRIKLCTLFNELSEFFTQFKKLVQLTGVIAKLFEYSVKFGNYQTKRMLFDGWRVKCLYNSIYFVVFGYNSTNCQIKRWLLNDQ